MFFTYLFVSIFIFFVNISKAFIDDSEIFVADDDTFKTFLPWSNQTITYSILNKSRSLSPNDTKAAFRYAFDQWSAVIPRDFIEIVPYTLPVDIRINFVAGENDERFYNSSLLSYTSPNGAMYFNDDKLWKKYSPGDKVDKAAKDIIWVAMHNIGHILGLEHNRKLKSIMMPFHYRFTEDDERYKYPKLSDYDIKNIQQIYGSR